METEKDQQLASYLFEGNVFDAFLDQELRAKLISVIRNGVIRVLITDLTYQDLDATRDTARHDQLLEALEEIGPEMTGNIAILIDPELPRSRPTYPGEYTMPVGQESWELYLRLNGDQRADARQAVNAHNARATLVTSDRPLARRARTENIDAVTRDEFIEYLRSLPTS